MRDWLYCELSLGTAEYVEMYTGFILPVRSVQNYSCAYSEFRIQAWLTATVSRKCGHIFTICIYLRPTKWHSNYCSHSCQDPHVYPPTGPSVWIILTNEGTN